MADTFAKWSTIPNRASSNQHESAMLSESHCKSKHTLRCGFGRNMYLVRVVQVYILRSSGPSSDQDVVCNMDEIEYHQWLLEPDFSNLIKHFVRRAG